MLDVTALSEAKVGDEVVFVGRQGEQIITLGDVVNATDISVTELLQRLRRQGNMRRV